MIAVRFAPSPTGYLHIGNARTALWNMGLARRQQGSFLLRLDDTDRERSEERFAAAIIEDLAWLGIVPDRILRQSHRLPRYALALDRLRETGRVYPAYDTAEELERKRRRQKARGLPPVYDRAALALTDGDRARLEAEGRRPHYRFRLSGETVRWRDGVRGECAVETASLSDPVLVRADGTVLYTLASVVDDLETGITEVVRGEDHVSNTAVQIEIIRALGGTAPRFAHHNLIVAASGEAMSKRTGALSIRSFREAGAEPLAVAAVAAITGTAHPVPVLRRLDELLPLLDLSALSRAPAKFDPAEIMALSARVLHGLSPADVAPKLATLGLDTPFGHALFLAVRSNLVRLEEITHWAAIVAGDPLLPAGAEPPEADRAFLATAAEHLPTPPWDGGSWGQWTAAVAAATGRKGRALFLPLRRALTGREAGPEMAALLPLMAPETVRARLSAPAA